MVLCLVCQQILAEGLRNNRRRGSVLAALGRKGGAGRDDVRIAAAQQRPPREIRRNVPKNLVIVESPAKARTIEKYMGKDFKVLASMGHVRDLPKSSFGIDINGGVRFAYEALQQANTKKALSAIRKAAKEAESVWL